MLNVAATKRIAAIELSAAAVIVLDVAAIELNAAAAIVLNICLSLELLRTILQDHNEVIQTMALGVSAP